MYTTKAKVRWFDTLRGEGLVRLPDGESVFIERSAILPDTNKYQFSDENEAFLDKHVYQGQEVMVQVIEDSHFTQVCNYIPVDENEAREYMADVLARDGI